MNWLILTFISVIFRAVYGVMTKVLSNRVKTSAYTQAALVSLIAAILVLITAPFSGGISLDFSNANLLALLLVILGQGFGNILYYVAIKHLSSSTAQISFSSILIFNTVLSLLFLNLHLSAINIIGLCILIAAILLVTLNRKIEINQKGIGLMILAAFMFSIFQLASGVISKQINSPTYLFLEYIGSFIVTYVFFIKQINTDLLLVIKDLRILQTPFLTALPSLGQFVFAYLAYRTAPEPSRVAMIATSQVVIAVILSYIFLKEKTHAARKISAAIMVVFASILIKS